MDLQDNLEDFLTLVTFFGYVKRVSGYYVIREDDGYINVSYNNGGVPTYTGFGSYNFHKNFTVESSIKRYKMNKEHLFPSWMRKYRLDLDQIDDIDVDFKYIKDLESFLCEYHIQSGRDWKINKLI